MNWNTRVTELLKIKYPIIQGPCPSCLFRSGCRCFECRRFRAGYRNVSQQSGKIKSRDSKG